MVSNGSICMSEDEFAGACRNAGLKVTPQRVAIYSALASTTTHPDVEWVYGKVRSAMPSISLDTVYRTLEQLSTLGIIMKIEVTDKRSRYDANPKQHAHFICIECGDIIDIDHAGFKELSCETRIDGAGFAKSLHLQIRGKCFSCSEH